MGNQIASAVTLLLAAGAAFAARPALAYCDDGCGYHLPVAVAPTSTAIAVDGVLGFLIADGRAETAFQFFMVTVRDAEGMTVAGNLELNASYSVIVWRPTAPWVPGASYTVLTEIDGSAWAELEYGSEPDSCPMLPTETTVTIDPAALPAPAAPPVIVESRHTIVPDLALDALVCCNGAYPHISGGPGSCTRPYLQDYRSCASRRSVGSLRIDHTLDLEGLPLAAAGNLASRIVDARNQPWFGGTSLLAPECLRLEILDIARGQVFVDERCFGDDIAEQLGTIAADPSPELAEMCEDHAYVCEVEDRKWDATRCKSWPEDSELEGCGCASGARLPIVWLGGLLLLRRRRRGAQRLGTARG